MPRWILLGIASAVIFADSVGYTIVIPVLPTFAQELSLGETWAGILYASYGLISVLLYLPFGYLVDRWGERVWLAGGYVSAGWNLIGFCSGLRVLASAWLSYGSGRGCVSHMGRCSSSGRPPLQSGETGPRDEHCCHGL